MRMGLRATFHIPPTGMLDVFEQADTDIERAELASAVFAGGDEWFEYFSVISGTNDVASTLRASNRVKTVESEPISQLPQMQNFLTLVEEDPSFIVTTLSRNGAIPYRVYLEDGSITVVTVLEDWNHLKDVADVVEAEYSSFELLGTSQVSGAGFPLGSGQNPSIVFDEFSDEQLQTLLTAYNMGFFEVPQEATSKELATELDVSQSAVSERLRRAQQNVCRFLFGDRS